MAVELLNKAPQIKAWQKYPTKWEDAERARIEERKNMQLAEIKKLPTEIQQPTEECITPRPEPVCNIYTTLHFAHRQKKPLQLQPGQILGVFNIVENGQYQPKSLDNSYLLVVEDPTQFYAAEPHVLLHAFSTGEAVRKSGLMTIHTSKVKKDYPEKFAALNKDFLRPRAQQ